MTNITEEAAEAALERAGWCLLVPTEHPEDPDIIGPFAAYEEAANWALSYPDCTIRKMITPEFEVLHRRERQEDAAFGRPRN